MLQIHEVFDTDAERTMVLTGRHLTGVYHEDPRQAYMPNNKLLVKDPTHSARRALSRPWTCVQQIKEIVTLIIVAPSSITKRISNSLIFRAVFEKLVLKIDQVNVVTLHLKNLASRGENDAMFLYSAS